MQKLLKEILLHKHFQKLGVYGFGQLFNLVTPLLVAPYIISVCGFGNYGTLSVALAFSFFLLVFIDYGSEIVSVREVAIHRADAEKVSSIFLSTQTAKLGMLAVMTTLCLLLLVLVPHFRENFLLYCFSLSILVGQALSPVWLLQGLEKYGLITIINITSKLLYMFLVLLFVKTADDFIYINLYWGIGMIVANVSVLLYLNRIYRFRFSKALVGEGRSYLKTNFKIFVSQVSTALQLYLPLMLVGWFGSDVLAGKFKVIEQIVVIFRTYLLLFFNFIYPNICFKLQEGYRKTLRFWAFVNSANLFFVLFLILLVFVFKTEIISHFSDENTDYLVQLLQIALLIPIVQAFQIPLKQMVLALEHTHYYVIMSIIQTILMVFLIVFSVQFFTLFEVIWSIIISETVISFAYLYILLKPGNRHSKIAS